MAVDDDRDILELIRLSLDQKYDVCTFNDPMFALQSVQIVEPDLIVLDIMMPKLTGYQFVEQLKGNPRFAEIPVVFLSAKDSNRDVKYGYKLGASVYLTKPFQPDRLLRNVDSLFARVPGSPRGKKHPMEELRQRLQLGSEYGFNIEAPNHTAGPAKSAAQQHASAEEEEEQEESAKNPRWLD